MRTKKAFGITSKIFGTVLVLVGLASIAYSVVAFLSMFGVNVGVLSSGLIFGSTLTNAIVFAGLGAVVCASSVLLLAPKKRR